MRILLVDDDTAVIQALLAVLKTLPGYEIRVATTAVKALEHATSLEGSISSSQTSSWSQRTDLPFAMSS
jgi:CheY-like chemotaxis protein